MARRGPKCQVCEHPSKLDIERGSGPSKLRANLATKYSVSVRSIENHRARHMNRAEVIITPTGPKTEGPAPPDLPVTATPLEQARAQTTWLQARLQWANQEGMPVKVVNDISAQMGKATTLLAKLSGSLAITESQIVRSLPFQRIMTVIREALVGHPKALEAVVQAVARFNEGGTP